MSKGLIKNSFKLAALLAIVCLASADNKSNSNTATQPRQSAATILGTLGSLVPGLIANVGPLVLLFGIGALMVPALGLGALSLFREGRRSSPDTQLPYHNPYGRPVTHNPNDFYFMTARSFPSLSNINTSAVMHGLSEIFEVVVKALDNVDKKYN